MTRAATAPVSSTGTTWEQATAVGRALGALDGSGDALFDRLRGRRGADTAAALLSNLSDYGLVWVLVAAVKARRPGEGRRRAVVTLAVAGMTSYAVNRGIKRLVQRQRPEEHAGQACSDPLPVRRPTSTSFPSGHTLAAFTTAVAMPETRRGQAAALTFAGAVAASRVHLRAHHASDVVGGAAVGALLGVVVRGVVRRRPE